MTSKDLVLMLLETRDVKSIGFADISNYPEDYTVSNPNFQITVPGFPTRNIPFTPKSANVYYSADLGISEEDDYVPIPDGIYTVTYSINNSSNISITKSFLRVDNILCNYYNAFLSIDLDCTCDGVYIREQKAKLGKIKLFIEGAIVSANNEDFITSFKLYNKAERLISKMGNCNCK